MRPVTKVVLVLALVGLAIGVLVFTSRDRTGTAQDQPAAPEARVAEKAAADPPAYSDPIATYQRWTERMSRRTEEAAQPPAPGTPPERVVVPPAQRDLLSSSRNEGTVVALRHSDEPVAGADPPGPVLRPDGVRGEVVTGPLRRRTEDAGRTHTVVGGDTLYGIAVQYYGDAKFVGAITRANPGLDPNRLRVGDRIILPARDAEEKAARPPEPPKTKVYVVQKGDTLIGIARRVYGDGAMYPKIYEANKDVLSSLNARLYAGQRLRLPEP
jgi:nucleoid-associated protein YgaU